MSPTYRAIVDRSCRDTGIRVPSAIAGTCSSERSRRSGTDERLTEGRGVNVRPCARTHITLGELFELVKNFTFFLALWIYEDPNLT